MTRRDPLGAPSSERWTVIAPVLDRTLELGPERQAEFLAGACSADPALRLEVERLLHASELAKSFLGDSAAEYASPMLARVARHQALAPGDRLAGYQIERELGRGGMATVYLARDLRHDRLVALKVLRQELSATLGAERFVRETAIAARLNHPHILALFDSGSLDVGFDRALYYAMPYVEGRSLRERLREEPQLPIDEAVDIARQVADALDHAHHQGIVHRDIKPENVLLAGAHAFVADFGIARALGLAGAERLTETGLALGTPTYMSPEQATAGKVDGRSDLYSLGCMLYEMLAGQPPFTGPTAQAVLARHAVDPVPPLRTVRATVPQELERVVTRSLAKVPADRFPTAHAFAKALETVPGAALEQDPAASSLGMPLIFRAIRRHRALAAVLAGSAVLLVIAIALAAHSTPAKPSTLDRAAVAVAPFRVSGPDTSLGDLREGMVDLISTRLAGTETLHPVDPQALLQAWRGMSAGRSELSESQAVDLATRVGAGRLIMGEIVGSGSRLTIASRMLDVGSGRLVVQETVEGPVDSLPAVLDRLAARLLANASGQFPYRLASLTGVPLPALRAYLNGEAQDRRGFADSATSSFAEAIRIDSTFALAALRLIHANSSDDDHGAVGIAWRNRGRLSREDRADLTATLGPRYPAPSRYSEGIAAAERFVQVVPDDPRAWTQLGSDLFANGPLIGLAEAHSRAMAAFARAVALDSASVPALAGLIEAATAEGDTATARKALAVLRRQQRDSTSLIDFEPRWFLAAKTGDSATIHRLLRQDSMNAVEGTGRATADGWGMMRLGLQEGLDLRDAAGVLERALPSTATLTQRAGIRWGQAVLNGIRGRLDTSTVDSSGWGPSGLSIAPRSKDFAGPILGFLFTDLDSAGWDWGGGALLRQVGSQRPDQCCLARFAAGQYALATNRLDLAARAAADLRRYHGPPPDMDPDTVRGSEMSHELAVVLEAQIAARRHDPSAPERLQALDSALMDPMEDLFPLLGNLVAAHLHEERGEIAEARAALRRRWWGGWVDPSYVVYHREEGRLAALLGDTAGAIVAYRRYLALRGDADPPLQPRARAVRAALAALEHAKAGH